MPPRRRPNNKTQKAGNNRNAKPKSNNNGNGNNGNGMNSNASLSQATNVRGLGAPAGVIRLSGMGRIAQSTHAAATITDGEVIFDNIINVAAFPRLSRVGSAFQRYRFTKLSFSIQPMCPATTGGGYVAGFIKDPMDTDASFDSIQGSRGATIGKWWEHKVVHAIPAKDLLWTSLGESPRLYSPGKFVMTAVGSNTDIVNVSVLCSWEAELSVPSLESEDAPVTEFFTKYDIMQSDLVHNSNKLHFNIFGAGVNLPDNTILRANVPIYIDYQLGVGDITKAGFSEWKVTDSGTKLQWGIDHPAGNWVAGISFFFDGQPPQSLLSRGTRFEVISPNA